MKNTEYLTKDVIKIINEIDKYGFEERENFAICLGALGIYAAKMEMSPDNLKEFLETVLECYYENFTELR